MSRGSFLSFNFLCYDSIFVIQAARNFNSVAVKFTENGDEIKLLSTAITRLGAELRNIFHNVAEESMDNLMDEIKKTASQTNEGILTTGMGISTDTDVVIGMGTGHGHGMDSGMDSWHSGACRVHGHGYFMPCIHRL